MDKIVRKFVVERDTKNTRRFQEVVDRSQPLAIGTLYVKREVLEAFNPGGSLPEKLEVTIEIGG